MPFSILSFQGFYRRSLIFNNCLSEAAGQRRRMGERLVGRPRGPLLNLPSSLPGRSLLDLVWVCWTTLRWALMAYGSIRRPPAWATATKASKRGLCTWQRPLKLLCLHVQPGDEARGEIHLKRSTHRCHSQWWTMVGDGGWVLASSHIQMWTD